MNDYVDGLEESMLRRKIVKAIEAIIKDSKKGKVSKKTKSKKRA